MTNTTLRDELYSMFGTKTFSEIADFIESKVKEARKNTIEEIKDALIRDWDNSIDTKGRDAHWDVGDAISAINSLK